VVNINVVNIIVVNINVVKWGASSPKLFDFLSIGLNEKQGFTTPSAGRVASDWRFTRGGITGCDLKAP